MKIIKAGYEILDSINGEEVLKKIEKIARVCYKSEDKITEGSAKKMVSNLINSGHEAMLEHYSFSVKFIVDRGISHGLVRHRLASFAQESTRYCNYGHNGEITVILPLFFDTGFGVNSNSSVFEEWKSSCQVAEEKYMNLLSMGASPQQARTVLPNSLKTEVIMTANLREWRHFFKVRAAGVTGKPHPQTLEVTVPLLKEIKELLPIVFDDIIPLEVPLWQIW